MDNFTNYHACRVDLGFRRNRGRDRNCDRGRAGRLVRQPESIPPDPAGHRLYHCLAYFLLVAGCSRLATEQRTERKEDPVRVYCLLGAKHH